MDVDLQSPKLNLKVRLSFTYHDLCELSIKFAFFRHRLREVVKHLHSSRMIDSIANFGVIWARTETTDTTFLFRHFMKPVLSASMNHELKLTIKPSGWKITHIQGEIIKGNLFDAHSSEWPSTKTAYSRDYK